MAAHPKEMMSVTGPSRSSVSLLGAYLQLKVSLLTLLLLGSLGPELLGPQLIGQFLDSVHEKMSVLVSLALLFMSLAIVHQCVTACASYMSEDLSWRVTNALRLDLTLHCLSLDQSFHQTHTPGELIERIDGDIALLATFFSRFVFTVLDRLLLLVGIVVVTFLADWHTGLLLLVFVGLMITLQRPLQHIAVPHMRALRQTSAELASFFEERCSSIEDIQGLGAQGYVMLRLSHLARRLLRTTCVSRVTGRFFSSTIHVSLALVSAAVLLMGAYLLRSGHMSLGTIYVTYSYTVLLTQNLFAISFQTQHVQQATASIQRIAELYHTPITIIDGPGFPLPAGPLPVKFNQVSFGYTPEQRVLQDLSFELPAGRTPGLLGRMGSGKTTLTSLLSRAYDVAQGSIHLGGIDVRQVALSELRSRIGVVTQQIHLFHAAQAIQLANAHHRVSERFRQLNEVRRHSTLRSLLFTDVVLDSLARNTTSIATGIMLLLAVQAMKANAFPVSSLVLFVAYIDQTTTFTGEVSQSMVQYKQATVSLQRLQAILPESCAKTEIVAHSSVFLRGELPQVPVLQRQAPPLEQLGVRGLTYRYPQSGRGIVHITFHLQRGSCTVITGRIGSGKTTLLRAILGLLPRQAGDLVWNGECIAYPERFFVPPQSAYTPQIPHLWSETLKDNLLMGYPEEPKRLASALFAAVMARDVQTLQYGLDTQIGSKGTRLSGGQIQRTAAARMFLREPDLLVCDDFSSALDVETEQLLWERLFLKRDQTCLLVSHRRFALQHADHIIVLKDGHIADEGTLASLLESSEEMRQLWEGAMKHEEKERRQ
ncbi:MAG TPA: ABC transporter ATP-binding protein [Ktedonobacteraceae bacterium]|nr:ABC transporter ATP-binding protein [Ktedonobacteraceae bacterium]